MKESLIVKMAFGSHLYGTSTADSDVDIKGVFKPSLRSVLLNRIPKSITQNTKGTNTRKNTNEDMDIELYSLHYFIELACQGETVALDMLHAPEWAIIDRNYWTLAIWDRIVKNRDKFYTKSLKSFVGYARKQAAKFSQKGSRLNSVRAFMKFLEEFDGSKDVVTLKDAWNHMPLWLEHVYAQFDKTCNMNTIQICGKTFHETVKLQYIYGILKRFEESYGARAEQAARNEGIDWKAISHALRAAMEVKEILTDQTITFPLKEADYLIRVKKGELSFLDEVSPKLEEMMIELEELSAESTLPEKADREFWDDFIVECYE